MWATTLVFLLSIYMIPIACKITNFLNTCTVKCNCYKSMVRPVLEYVLTVWDPHTSANINKIQSVQRRAARFCLNNFSNSSSVTAMLSSLNLPPLKQRRERAKLIMMYKIVNDLVNVPKDLFIPSDSRLRSGHYKQLMT